MLHAQPPSPTQVLLSLWIFQEKTKELFSTKNRAHVSMFPIRVADRAPKKIRNEKAVLRSTMMGHDDEIALEPSHYTRCSTLVHSLGFFSPKKRLTELDQRRWKVITPRENAASLPRPETDLLQPQKSQTKQPSPVADAKIKVQSTPRNSSISWIRASYKNRSAEPLPCVAYQKKKHNETRSIFCDCR